MSDTSSAEVVGKRGKKPLTEEQKKHNELQFIMFHGTGEHTITTGVKVTPEQRSMLRSFAKSFDIGVDDVFAGILRRFAFDFSFPNSEKTGDKFYEVNSAVAEKSQYVIDTALNYDRSHDTGEISMLKKSAESMVSLKAMLEKAGMPISEDLQAGIDQIYAAIDALRTVYTADAGNEPETVPSGTEAVDIIRAAREASNAG